MKVTFTRTGGKRYRVSVEGAGLVSSFMEPAAGYDELLPHDMAHFVVENELGIRGGVFGQLAEGGNARTFQPIVQDNRRKLARRGNHIAAENRDDADLSERIVAIACRMWKGLQVQPELTNEVSLDDLMKICREFDAASSVWSQLKVGESMTLEWGGKTHVRGPRWSSRRSKTTISRRLKNSA